jgi:hypothetical protein
MSLEGPLRELGLHDVFQLLSLSRKTGALRIRSALRERGGTVLFESGRVVWAMMDAPDASATDGEGASDSEPRERVARITHELLAWREGHFAFEPLAPGAIASAVPQQGTSLTVDALLMEVARLADEWRDLADVVPHAGIVPRLRPAADAGATPLELDAVEWELLLLVDGRRDVHAIAARLRRDELTVARLVRRLVATGVLIADEGSPAPVETLADGRAYPALPSEDHASWRERGYSAALAGDLAAAVAHWEHYLRERPDAEDGSMVRETLAVAARLYALLQAHELQRDTIGDMSGDIVAGSAADFPA